MSNDKDHPLRAAVVAVVGTIGVSTILVTQWILPTQTASLNHEITILKEKLESATKETALAKKQNDALASAVVESKRAASRDSQDFEKKEKRLKAELFALQTVNIFRSGEAYPFGLDSVRVGDTLETLQQKYSDQERKENGKRISVRTQNEIFREIDYTHSSARKTQGRIDSIRYDTGRVDRLIDKSLPQIPDGWLKTSLLNALGTPIVLGMNNDCLFWRMSEKEGVYYLRDESWFEISGFITYPAGCSITDDQRDKLKQKSR